MASEHKHVRPQWAGKDIVDQDHAQLLDREAAVHEFEGKVPRHEAEDKTYGDYKRKQHAVAAAHHLRGMKVSVAAGDGREARKHGLMYQLHLQSLGHEPGGPVPDEVRQYEHVASGDGIRVYKFKPHGGDIFVLDRGETLGKKEFVMSDKTLQWQEHDDSTGGYLEAMHKAERSLYRTWKVTTGGPRDRGHVLVKHDGFKQTTIGYFPTVDEALLKAEELSKEGQQLDLTPMAAPLTEKSERSASSASGSSHSLSFGKDEEGSLEAKAEASASASATKCGKCGAASGLCKCGNMGKAETCRSCGKATNICGCKPAAKSEALAPDIAAQPLHKAVTPVSVYGVGKNGPEGVDPDQLQTRLHDLWVATSFLVDKAGK
jgi:hypothetical protein